MSELPLVDISGLRTGDRGELRKIAGEIGRAAREIGFFRIQRHGIDADLIEATYRIAERFFALPEHKKQQYYIGLGQTHRGYVPFTEKGDYADEVSRNYEAFDLGLDLPDDDPDFLAGNPVLGPNVWPDLVGFKETVSRYYAEISELGFLLCSALELYLDLPPGAITDHMSKPVSQLRLLHYVRPKVTTDRASVNMGAHTDYECLTLLHTRNPGLQVMTQDDTWIDVPVDHGAYVVNIGDMLETWSNGIFRSTPHRVLNLSVERFSMPYFVAANYHTEIRPFAQLIGPGADAKYKPFTAGEHLVNMLHRDFPYLRKRDPQCRSNPTPPAGLPVRNPFENRIAQGSA